MHAPTRHHGAKLHKQDIIGSLHKSRTQWQAPPERAYELDIRGVLCKSSRYAKNPLWLLAADLHRSLAQAPKACTRESVLHNARGIAVALCPRRRRSARDRDARDVPGAQLDHVHLGRYRGHGVAVAAIVEVVTHDCSVPDGAQPSLR